MPVTSQKNMPLTSAGADLGITGNTPGTDEDEEDKKRKLLQRKQVEAGLSPMGLASSMLLGGGMNG